MSIENKYEKIFRVVFPSPFSIALILTLVVFILSFIFQKPTNETTIDYTLNLLNFWQKGLWSDGGLIFALQMMLMLVLGHILALTPIVNRWINALTKHCSNNTNAAIITTFFTVLVSFFNWGMGLIFGAILARKIGEHSERNNLNINYPLIGACGYVGLMVWHGGISGSAPIKVAEANAIFQLVGDRANMPSSVSFSETVFSNFNLITSLILIIVLPLTAFWLSKKSYKKPELSLIEKREEKVEPKQLIGSEKIDNSRILSLLFGIIALITVWVMFYNVSFSISAINPNLINLSFLAFALLFHRSINTFLKSLDEAIQGASGILVQFPLYFGILGIMQHSGLMQNISNFFIEHSSNVSFNYLIFISAGIVNMLVPSGGGQWAVQGPIIIEAALAKGLPLGKSIMALAYGDQLTNMLQPFWALPLLGITKLKATQILPYTLVFMLVGFVIFSVAILIP